jgi:cytochrome c2
VKIKGLILALMAAVALTFGVSTMAFAGDAGKGKGLFEGAGKCKTCHKTDATKLVGPGLAGVKSRHTAPWLKKWIGGPQAVWDANDAEVQELKKRVGKEGKPKTAMAPGKLTEGEIEDVIAFLNTL